MPFPISFFPKELQIIITEVQSCYMYPRDYLCCSILSASACAIGNTYAIKVNDKWKERAVLFMAIVGEKGLNKSAPPTWAFEPIERREKLRFVNHQSYLREFSEDEQNKGKEADPLVQTVIGDSTIEAIVQQLNINKRGVLLFHDELAGFLNTFQRYSKGNDQEFYLSTWSGKPVVVNRKTQKPIRIDNPLLSIMGTIQPDVLKKSFMDKEDNGFFDRWLLCHPKGVLKEYWSSQSLNNHIQESYEFIMDKLLRLEYYHNMYDEITQFIVTYSPESWNVVFAWHTRNTNEINSTDSSDVRGIRAKMETYVHRFCLIHHMLEYACSDSSEIPDNISKASAIAATELCDYFIRSALNARSHDPAERNEGIFKDIYEMLPDAEKPFSTQNFIDICESFNVNERTGRRWLVKNTGPGTEKMFNKVKHGIYAKK